MLRTVISKQAKKSFNLFIMFLILVNKYCLLVIDLHIFLNLADGVRRISYSTFFNSSIRSGLISVKANKRLPASLSEAPIKYIFSSSKIKNRSCTLFV